MNTKYEKYFVIGFNKTATNTFDNMFKKNNLNSIHQWDRPWETDKYTCFSDNGNLNDYKKLDLKYKNAIFILNVRELDKWLISRFKHGLRHPSAWCVLSVGNCKQWINEREKYHKEILEYFSDRPNKIIIVNIDRTGWIEYICNQLNFKNKKVESLNVHKTNDSEEHKKIINLVNTTLEEMNYNKKTILFPFNNILKKYTNIYKNYI